MTPDTVIAGGGPAGAGVAAWLAEAGQRVVVLEKSKGPQQKVCGEFVSGEAGALLRRLGLDPDRLGALPLERVRLCAGDREAVATLPFPAWSLGRDVMDEALLVAATARGATVRRGITVTAIDPGARVRAGGATITAATAVLATGKHGLRGFPRLGATEPMIGFKQYWSLAPAQARHLDGHVEVHFFPGGYLGLQPAATGGANLCLAVTPSAFDQVGADYAALLAHAARHARRFADRLHGGEPLWPKPLAVAGLPYGFVLTGAATDGPHRVGDQLAVIPSFCGDGMAIALSSAALAARRILAGHPPADGTPFRGQVGLAQTAARLTTLPLVPGIAVATARFLPGVLVWLARGTRVRDRLTPMVE